MSKSIQIMAIAVAFVALTLISGVVYADEKNGKPFEAIWEAINEIELTPGPPGADGTDGITNVYQVKMEQKINNKVSTFHTVKATCVPLDTVLGGGVEKVAGINIFADRPDGVDGWLGIFETGSSRDKVVTVYAICATVTP